jgi:hypothetical protein
MSRVESVGRAVELAQMCLNRIGNGWEQLRLAWSEDMSKAPDCVPGFSSRQYDPDLEALGVEVRDHFAEGLVGGEFEKVTP